MAFLKKHAMILVAFFIAGSSYTLMSFSLDSSTQNLEWYERLSNGTYQLMPGAPSPEPLNGCADETEVICAKGFIPGDAPESENIIDTTPAVDRFKHESVK